MEEQVDTRTILYYTKERNRKGLHRYGLNMHCIYKCVCLFSSPLLASTITSMRMACFIVSAVEFLSSGSIVLIVCCMHALV